VRTGRQRPGTGASGRPGTRRPASSCQAAGYSDGGVARLEPRFVGRADELGELVAAMAGARAATPGLLLVGGEAGVGKSRLVAELTTHAVAQWRAAATG